MPESDIVATFERWSRPADNNKDPILAELKRLLVVGDTVLEIGSGSGQHAVHFAREMPGIRWQPTDRGEYFQALHANLARVDLKNIEPPLHLDVEHFPQDLDCDAAYCANVLHIMPERLMPALFDGVAANLRTGGLFVVYGPFKYGGAFTTDSNERFDGWLKGQGAEQGIRDIEAVTIEAERCGMALIEDLAMPANNQLLLFRQPS